MVVFEYLFRIRDQNTISAQLPSITQPCVCVRVCVICVYVCVFCMFMMRALTRVPMNVIRVQ